MTTGLRAVMVCVDYSDLLAITLPYNRHHFDSVMVVTSKADIATQSLALEQGCRLFVTDAFYQDNASFNKWLALENALDVYGRTGWLCLMDADVLWPKQIHPFWKNAPEGEELGKHLYSPLRHMMEDPSKWRCGKCDGEGEENIGKGQHYAPVICSTCDGRGIVLPPEATWKDYLIHRNVAEWAGYTQIFHAESCKDVLGDPPWHQVNWKHAGGADSFFQRKWPNDRKVRTPWNVLHLGVAGKNWYGRATPYLDGSTPENAQEKLQQCSNIWVNRRVNRANGVDQFKGERIIKD
jgi:hypothetical protein